MRDVGESSVVVVAEKVMVGLDGLGRVLETPAVDEKDVVPAVIVVVEERDAGAHRLDKVLLVRPGFA